MLTGRWKHSTYLSRGNQIAMIAKLNLGNVTGHLQSTDSRTDFI